METLVNKSNIVKIKSDIKELVEKQKFYKNQSKTVHIVGKRQMTAKKAQCEHCSNSYKLRIMYAVYGLMKGKSFSHTESHYSEENHPLKRFQYQIDKTMNMYSQEEI